MKIAALTVSGDPLVPATPRTSLPLRLRTQVKLRIRDAYAACLARIPDRWLLPIRTAYITAPEGGVQRDLAHRLLRAIRYKHPDPRLADFAIADAPHVRLANVNSIVARHLYWFGLHGWEGREVRAWQYFCARATRVLEIGANIGFYTVCGAHAAPHAEYTAVEPHPRTAGVLRRNLQLNGLSRVSVVQAAVVGQKTTERMSLLVPAEDHDDTPPGSFLASGGEVSLAAMAAYEVPVVEMRGLLEGVDLIKLDVEGYEFDILSAVRTELLRTRPTIFVEVLPEATRLQRFLAALARNGFYTIYVSGDDVRRVDPADVEAGRLLARHHTRDVFLVRADRPLPAGGRLDGAIG